MIALASELVILAQAQAGSTERIDPTPFIWLSYAATGLVVAALIAHSVLTARRYRRELADLEREGIARRVAPEQRSTS